MYIECDYIAPDEESENSGFQENRRIREELGIPQDAFYHFDTPCTAENQIRLLTQAGFHSVEKVWQKGNTAIFVAYK
ncbi:MAG: tRNA (Cmo5U34)-methyltransferase [Eubacteriales bacterium]|jgi:tRNA (cmo5U34)-methyltransferase